MSRLRTIGVEEWYEVIPMGEGITLIHERWIIFRCNMWHVRGRDRDLLFASVNAGSKMHRLAGVKMHQAR
jgi:hypothetical protein